MASSGREPPRSVWEIAKVRAAAVDRILLIFRFDDLRLQNHLTQNAMPLPTHRNKV